MGTGRRTLIAHTADVGFRASATALPGLFEEATAALGDLGADVEPGVGPSRWAEVAVEAADLPGLAFGWLNQAIAIAEIEHAAILGAEIDRVDRPAAGARDPEWSATGRIGLRPFAAGGVKPRIHVKSATFHGLSVRRSRTGWSMRAYLDV
jgi:SHS2 domain-containing protein